MPTQPAKGRAGPAKRTATKSKSSKAPDAQPIVPASGGGLAAIVRDVRSWTDFMLGIANTAADLSLLAGKAKALKPVQTQVLAKSGGLLSDLRSAAGLTLQDVGKAINLKDVSLLEAVESGRVGLPFEIILRLASVLGRNDPIPVVMQLTRSYNPGLWKTLEGLGIGKLVVQGGREREFANIYRASDEARALDDTEFAALLAFVKTAFDAAMAFRAKLVAA